MSTSTAQILLTAVIGIIQLYHFFVLRDIQERLYRLENLMMNRRTA